MIARVEALKRKVYVLITPDVDLIRLLAYTTYKIADVQDTTSHPMQRALRARADHLMGFETTTPEDSTYEHWVDVRMQRWIVDSMLRSGRFEAAQTLANDLRIDVSFTKYLHGALGRPSSLRRRLWSMSLSSLRYSASLPLCEVKAAQKRFRGAMRIKQRCVRLRYAWALRKLHYRTSCE